MLLVERTEVEKPKSSFLKLKLTFNELISFMKQNIHKGACTNHVDKREGRGEGYSNDHNT